MIQLFQRDYVLLIDPLLTAEIDQASDEETINTVEKIAKKPVIAVTQSTKANNSNNKNSGKKQSADKKIIVQKNVANDNIVLTINASAQKTASNNAVIHSTVNNPAAANLPKESKPRLSISSGDAFNNANSIGLRLDKQLNFSAETLPEALASNIAAEDEATVLSNRLAHLEQQITSLQQRNNVLEAEKIIQSTKYAKSRNI